MHGNYTKNQKPEDDRKSVEQDKELIEREEVYHVFAHQISQTWRVL